MRYLSHILIYITTAGLFTTPTLANAPHFKPNPLLDIPHGDFIQASALFLNFIRSPKIENLSKDLPSDPACSDWVNKLESDFRQKLFNPAYALTDLDNKVISYSGFILPNFFGKVNACAADPDMTQYAMALKISPATNAKLVPVNGWCLPSLCSEAFLAASFAKILPMLPASLTNAHPVLTQLDPVLATYKPEGLETWTFVTVILLVLIPCLVIFFTV
jgi:peptidoglycan/LPS O-acetylase OafA/YrhL